MTTINPPKEDYHKAKANEEKARDKLHNMEALVRSANKSVTIMRDMLFHLSAVCNCEDDDTDALMDAITECLDELDVALRMK